MAGRLINARIETAAARPAFREALRRRRCLVPADGFYEWRGSRGQRSPHHIALPEGDLFAMAGLFEHWEDPAGGSLESCTLLTTEANEIVAPIHPRMPVIVDPGAWDAWLDPRVEDGERALASLRCQDAGRLLARSVGHRVDDARLEGPACLEPDPQGMLGFDA
jgi:putative SOS response-associated peptidase YedK